MSADDDQTGLADESEHLLGNGDRSHSQHRGIGYSVWIQCSLYASHTAKAALHTNKVYALFVFLPLGIVASALGWHPVTVSLFNLFAIIPLSALLSYAADELSNIVGELMGGLINATFGNAVELVVRPPQLPRLLSSG
jgi:Ca2+:H+ antiporter